jgi:NAD(P)-dependent dehydrogenase (short-subunit alcohol dehydrogenase family)
MKEFAGKVAFVTGAAQGIGLGIARALAREGVSVAMADIAGDAVERAGADVVAAGGRALALALDVSDFAAMERAAAAVEARFGKVHIVVNNAGVAPPPKPVSTIGLDEWAWLIGVNLYGAIHGIRAFLPLIRAHGEGGHIVNTASIAGFQVRPGRGTGGYAATKYAVVALSESLAQELAGSGIGVSVLAPAAVNTKIYESARRRPPRFGGPFEPPPPTSTQIALAGGWPPDAVGGRVVQAIRDEEFFIFTHEEPREWLEERHRRVLAGFDSAARYKMAHGLSG